MHAHVQRRRARAERALDTVLACYRSTALERCKGCRAHRLMSGADVRELERAIAVVARANAEGYCVWCSGRRDRAKRAKDAVRWLR